MLDVLHHTLEMLWLFKVPVLCGAVLSSIGTVWLLDVIVARYGNGPYGER